MTRDRALKALRRRRDFLAGRIENYRAGGNPSHDKAELAALVYAIALIEAVAAAVEAGVVRELEQ